MAASYDGHGNCQDIMQVKAEDAEETQENWTLEKMSEDELKDNLVESFAKNVPKISP